jgi:hypothetical protein
MDECTIVVCGGVYDTEGMKPLTKHYTHELILQRNLEYLEDLRRRRDIEAFDKSIRECQEHDALMRARADGAWA